MARDEMSSSALSAANWWACFANDGDAYRKSEEIEMRGGKSTYKGTFHYSRLVCWTVDSYWDGSDSQDAIQCIYGHIACGPDIEKCNGLSNFVAYRYSEEDLSTKTTLD